MMPPPGEPGSTAPIVIVSHPRDPGDFTGIDNADADEWLRMYERVSVHNRWDDTIMLANVAYHLKKTAGTWFLNNEARLTSWDVFKQEFLDAFSDSAARQLAAKNDLSSRTQSCTESYVAYIQDVLALCAKVDPNMPESDKIGHVLKGIADDAFHLLMCKECPTIASVLKECRRFEQAKCRRIAQQFTRLPHTAATSSCTDLTTPPSSPTAPGPMPHSDTLTKIVRREIEAMAPATVYHHGHDPTLPTISLIQAVVREEVANLGIQPVCAMACPDVRQNLPPSFSRNSFPRRYDAPPRYRRRNPAEWRTPDDRPICFECSRVGHVARYCRQRWTSPAHSRFSATPYSSDDRPIQFPTGTQPQYVPDSSHSNRPDRSPSPQRRQSRSPQPRRPSPPTSYARTSPGN